MIKTYTILRQMQALFPRYEFKKPVDIHSGSGARDNAAQQAGNGALLDAFQTELNVLDSPSDLDNVSLEARSRIDI